MVRTRKKLTETQQQFIKTGVTAPIAEFSQKATPYTFLPLSQLESWSGQPRQYFSQESLELLAETIRKNGIKHPLLVRPKKGHQERYEVIAGERRFQAGQLAQEQEIPVLIKELDDQQALEEALSENLHRENLNPIETLDGLLKLLSTRLKLDEDSTCQLLRSLKYQWEKLELKPQNINIPNPDDEQQILITQTFEQFGYNWFSFVANQLQLRNLPPELYQAIAEGKIEYSKGLLFKGLPDSWRKKLLEEAIAQKWTQAEIQQKIREQLNQFKTDHQLPKLTPQQELNLITSRLKKVKPWQNNKDIWKKIQRNLSQIDKYLAEIETPEEKEASPDSELT